MIRRWRYLVLGANNEDEASALAEEIGQKIPAHTSLNTQASTFVLFEC